MSVIGHISARNQTVPLRSAHREQLRASMMPRHNVDALYGSQPDADTQHGEVSAFCQGQVKHATLRALAIPSEITGPRCPAHPVVRLGTEKPLVEAGTAGQAAAPGQSRAFWRRVCR